MRRPVPFVVALFVAACSPEQQNPNVFNWSRELAAGGTLHVRDMNGAITVIPARDGKTARVQASARWRHGNPERDLQFIANTEGSDATICVLWGTGKCTATEYTSRRNHRGLFGWSFRRQTDATVDFTVEVPAGVAVDVSTMNGALAVTAQAPVRAKTMNGAIHVATAIGPVAASTLNGDVDVRMTTLQPTGDVSAETTNGNASAYVPQNLDGKVSLRTINGETQSWFPLTATGASKRHLQGTLGAGGRSVNVRTTNGTATLGALDALGAIIQAKAP